MRGHGYKRKGGFYFRGRTRGGRYYTRQGCLLPIIGLLIIIAVIGYII